MKEDKTNVFCLRTGQIFKQQVLKVSMQKTEIIVQKLGQKPHDVRRPMEFQIPYDLKTIFMHVDEM